MGLLLPLWVPLLQVEEGWMRVGRKKKGNQARVQMDTQHWREEEEGMWWCWGWVVVEKKKGNQARVQMDMQHWREEDGVDVDDDGGSDDAAAAADAALPPAAVAAAAPMPTCISLVTMTHVLMTDMQKQKTHAMY